MGRAKMGELKRAAGRLGVTRTTLREHGWTTASAERVKAVEDDPAGWLAEAQDSGYQSSARRRQLRDRKETAARLSVQVRAVKEHGIMPCEAGGLLAARPAWLVSEQAMRRAQADREARDLLRRDLTDALVTSACDAWFQELKRAVSDGERDAIDTQWASEIDRAEREARQLAGELTPEQVRARTGRERDAARIAAVYRAIRLLRRASGAAHG
jgi:hypothetical protein